MSKNKELTLDDGYDFKFPRSSNRSKIINVEEIMKYSNIPEGIEQKRIFPGTFKKKKKKVKVELPEEVVNDITVLQMRSVFDKKRFYKKNDILPSKDIQVGRVLDNPTDFYSSRLPKKLRKSTLVDELLSDAKFQKDIKKSYKKILQVKNASNPKYKKRRNKKDEKKNKVK